jgi:hypothetical protein
MSDRYLINKCLYPKREYTSLALLLSDYLHIVKGNYIYVQKSYNFYREFNKI